jgi:hypothetical protein
MRKHSGWYNVWYAYKEDGIWYFESKKRGKCRM